MYPNIKPQNHNSESLSSSRSCPEQITQRERTPEENQQVSEESLSLSPQTPKEESHHLKHSKPQTTTPTRGEVSKNHEEGKEGRKNSMNRNASQLKDFVKSFASTLNLVP